jgi:ribosome-associated heat shock protein Hsp15
MRIDVALHALRLFPSRTRAMAAVERGEVLLGGARVKPSHPLRAGDLVTLRAAGTSRVIEVLELPRRGLSRTAARALLRERNDETAFALRPPDAPDGPPIVEAPRGRW